VIDAARGQGVERAIVIDCTAAEGMAAPLARALDLGYAWSWRTSGPWRDRGTAPGHSSTIPWCVSRRRVSAGLPVLSTLRYLVDTGDSIRRIEGALSGTLGYLCSRLEDGDAFSTVVREAKAKGYTEPDPREDLSGIDVARKVLILGARPVAD